ncbi:MAG TPA: hypothetical protein DCL54_11885 [Alphaproteobacteria bacterium]|nr:hypothetical protein [Alphaproteobacteria bacterium]HAJ47267.1 hypothetical protein [Alphaproteobacteria bacterium]
MERDKANCANCGTALSGPFCHVCGQKAVDLHKPFWWIVGEFLDSVFSYDSRTLRTLWLLFTDPGEFTRIYNAGQRASVLPPFRTFIIATLVFFVALEMTGVAMVRVEMVPARTVLPDAVSAAAERAGAKVGSINMSGETMELRFDLLVAPPPGGFPNAVTGKVQENLDEARKKIDEAQRDDPPESGTIEGWFLAKARDLTAGLEHILADPLAFNTALNVWLPRMTLLLVPVFALFLALLHWRPRAFYIEHLIFSLHVHTVTFVALAAVVGLVGFFGGNAIAWTVLPILGVYVLMGMLRVYGRSVWWTSLKFIVLMLVYGFVLLMALLFTFLLALADA